MWWCSSSAGVSVYPGSGNGTFQAPAGYLANALVARIVVANLNNESKPDIALLMNNSTFARLLNNGSGAFANSANPSAPACGDIERRSGLAHEF